MQDNYKNNDEQLNEKGLIIGRNPVLEALRSGREIDKLFIAKGNASGPLVPIIEKCRNKKIVIKEVPTTKLDFMCGNANHQGVIALIPAQSYYSLDDIFSAAEENNEPPFIIVCDGIEDPHNLGAIIRTAEATGVHGIIIPKHRSVTVNATVAKSACGALEYMKICKVTNIANTIDNLKKRGVWIFGADMDGEYWCQSDYKTPTAIIIGSEGNGISRLVREKCDQIISMPMCGKINSLNASVAAGVLMYEVAKQRKGI
ncbi:MAG: 23S rRNA (guanosine(2251)-2'-O)-methyltransferase RlmB [Clostridia bacterium]|nr:23S rRNA (guanosine(2251)-2'-O)-methyltransferase RlmB [Clostridia bacterium]